MDGLKIDTNPTYFPRYRCALNADGWCRVLWDRCDEVPSFMCEFVDVEVAKWGDDEGDD